MKLSKAITICDDLIDIYKEISSKNLKFYKETDPAVDFVVELKYNPKNFFYSLEISEKNGKSIEKVEMMDLQRLFCYMRRCIWRHATSDLGMVTEEQYESDKDLMVNGEKYQLDEDLMVN